MDRKIIGLGALCVACCAYPLFATLFAGAAFGGAISLTSLDAGMALGIVLVVGLGAILWRKKAAGSTIVSCGCGPETCVTSGQQRADDEPPIACTLNAADYKDRIATIRRLANDALLRVERDDLSLRLTYSRESLPRVRETVRAEQACCAFLSFDLRERAEGIELAITAPVDAREAAHALFDEFAPPDVERRLTLTTKEFAQ